MVRSVVWRWLMSFWKVLLAIILIAVLLLWATPAY